MKMKRLFAMLLCVALTVLTPLAVRAEADYGTIIGDAPVILRNVPSERARKLTEIEPGEQVICTGRDSQGYVEVVYDGITGFIEAEALQPTVKGAETQPVEAGFRAEAVLTGKDNELFAVNAHGGVNMTGKLSERDAYLEAARDWTDVATLVRAERRLVGLKRDGTVYVTDSYRNSRDFGPDRWHDIVKVVCAGQAIAGLRSDGSVVCYSVYGGNDGLDFEESLWKDMADIALTEDALLGLRRDGTVIYAGKGDYNRGEVAAWTGIRKIYASDKVFAAIDSQGTVHAVGVPVVDQINGWTNIRELSIYGKGSAFCGIRNDGTVVTTLDHHTQADDWTDVVKVQWGVKRLAALTANGRVHVTSTLSEDPRAIAYEPRAKLRTTERA